MSALGSQQGILISASTVSHCGSPVWKNGSCSEHQCIGLLEKHCSYVNVKSADTSAVGKFTIARVWHKAEQIIRVNLAFGHAWMSDYIRMYICLLVYDTHTHTHTHTRTHTWICVYEFMNKVVFQTHLDTCMCKFMNKKWFSRLTVSRRPQAGGMY